MSSTGRGRDSRSIEFLPLKLHHAKGVSVAGDDIFACVASGTTEEDDFGLADLGDGVSEACKGHLAEGVHFLDFLVAGLARDSTGGTSLGAHRRSLIGAHL